MFVSFFFFLTQDSPPRVHAFRHSRFAQSFSITVSDSRFCTHSTRLPVALSSLAHSPRSCEGPHELRRPAHGSSTSKARAGRRVRSWPPSVWRLPPALSLWRRGLCSLLSALSALSQWRSGLCSLLASLPLRRRGLRSLLLSALSQWRRGLCCLLGLGHRVAFHHDSKWQGPLSCRRSNGRSSRVWLRGGTHSSFRPSASDWQHRQSAFSVSPTHQRRGEKAISTHRIQGP